MYNCYSNEFKLWNQHSQSLLTEKKTAIVRFPKLTDKGLFIQLDSLKKTRLEALGEQADGWRQLEASGSH